MATKVLRRGPIATVLSRTSRPPTLNLRPPNLPQHAQQQRRHLSAYGYEQAKALTFATHGDPAAVLNLHTHSLSPPHSDLLTLRFLAAPINPADINQIQGVYPSPPTWTTSLGTQSPLAVAGNEGVAEVIALGEKARGAGWKKGDWALMRGPGFGTWRTHAQTSMLDVVKLEESVREGISAVQAGTVSINPVTAYRMLKDFVHLKEGEWWVQNGANSGVGRAAIQLGRAWGLKSINVIRARDGEGAGEKEERLKRELRDLGADVVITDAELQSQGIGDMSKAWTDGGREKIRLALNCVGGKPATAMAKLLAPGGSHFVTYGAMSKQPLLVPASMLIFKDVHFDGFWVSKWAEREPEEKKRTVEDVLGMIRQGTLKDVPIEEIKWEWETKGEELVEKVKGALEGYREGKGVFVFGKT